MFSLHSPYQQQLWQFSQNGILSYKSIGFTISGNVNETTLSSFLLTKIKNYYIIDTASDISNYVHIQYTTEKADFEKSKPDFNRDGEKVLQVFIYQEGDHSFFKLYCHSLLADTHSLILLINSIASFVQQQEVDTKYISYEKFIAWESDLVNESNE